MDEFIKEFNISYPQYIKIDVGGYERFVLVCMEGILSNKKLKSVLIEIYTGDESH